MTIRAVLATVVLSLSLAHAATLTAAPDGAAAPAPAAETSQNGASAVAEVTETARAATEAVKAVTIGDQGQLLVNGRPFFPLMNFFQSPESFKNARAMGLNSYFMPGNKPEPKEYLEALAAQGLYGMVPHDEKVVGHPALLAYVLPHEPDKAFLSGKEESSPAKMAELAATIRKSDPHRPVVLDLSPRFMTDELLNEGLADEKRRTVYADYAKAADVLTFNVYPIWGHNRPERIDWVAEAADELRCLAGANKPFLAIIETGKGWRGIPVEEQKEVSPQDIRSQVWMAITGGASGIVYFTHRFTPSFTEHAPDAERHAEILKINQQITRLAPAILAAPTSKRITMKLEGDLPCRLKATQLDGQTYIFAQNIDMQRRGAIATFTVSGLKSGSEIVVVDEDRKIAASDDGVFSDSFGPLDVRIYRLDQ